MDWESINATTCIIELALLNSHQMLESFFRWALVAAAAALIGASIKNLLD